MQALNREAAYRKNLERSFAPEFINRIDDIVTFGTLSDTDVLRIVELELGCLSRRVSELGYSLDASDEAKRLLVKQGYEPAYGVRSLRRTILDRVEEPLSELIVAGAVHAGDRVTVCADGDRIELSVAPAGLAYSSRLVVGGYPFSLRRSFQGPPKLFSRGRRRRAATAGSPGPVSHVVPDSAPGRFPPVWKPYPFGFRLSPGLAVPACPSSLSGAGLRTRERFVPAEILTPACHLPIFFVFLSDGRFGVSGICGTTGFGLSLRFYGTFRLERKTPELVAAIPGEPDAGRAGDAVAGRAGRRAAG